MGNSQSKQQNKQDEPKPQNISEIVFIEKKVKEASVPHANNTPLKQNFEDTEKEKESSGWLPLLVLPFSLWAYTRLRRFRSLRYMIQPKNYVTPGWALTKFSLSTLSYDSVIPKVQSITGDQGIGKSCAALRLINQDSKKCPIIYIPLKTIVNRYDEESVDDKIKNAIKLPSKYNLSSHLKWSNTPLVSALTFLRMQLKSLKFIRDHHKFSFMAYLSPLAMPFIWMPALPFLQSSWYLAIHGPEVLYVSFASLYLWGVYPILKYCWTRYIPALVFDDVDIMAFNKDYYEVQKCGSFYNLVYNQLASVIVLSSNEWTSSVLMQMPSARDAVSSYQLIFDLEYTYNQILDDQNKCDGKEGDFKKMKQTFMKNLFARDHLKNCLSNDAIRYFILELKDRELSLREFQIFFNYETLFSHDVFDEFKKKFQEEIQKKTFENDQQKQSKVKEIVKEVCKIYDHYYKDQIGKQVMQIMKLCTDKERQSLKLLVRYLGFEAQSEQMKFFDRTVQCYPHYKLFVQKKILKQNGWKFGFQSKVIKVAFKLWFQEDGLKGIEKDDFEVKKLTQKVK